MAKRGRPPKSSTAAKHPTPRQIGGETLSSMSMQSERIDPQTRRLNSLHGSRIESETMRPRAPSRSGAIAGWDDLNITGEGTRTAGGQTKYVGAVERKSAIKSQAAFSELIGAYTTFGLDPEQDNFDALDLMAQHIIDLLLTNVYTFANLTRFERNLLYRFFYKTNPILGRILDLHTDLPLSKVRLQAPPNLSEIAKDYIMQFFNRVLDRLNFSEFLRDFVLAHVIYGEAVAFVDDYYKEFHRVLQDIQVLEEQLFDHPSEDQKWMDSIDKAYDANPKGIKLSDRIKYVKMYFQGFFEPDYTGPDGLKVVPFYKINEFLENDDINYLAIKYQLSEPLNKMLSAGFDNDFLKEVGYSPGMLYILNDSELRESKHITVDSDSYSGLPFVFRLKRSEGSSLILRVLNEALEWESSKRAMRAKIENIGRIGRIVTSEELSDGQTAALRMEVQQMLDDPGHAIVANFPIDWKEVNTEVRQQLDDLIAASTRIAELLAMGSGMPSSLITGETQYSGASIKLEVLNVEYHSFKQRIQSMIEERFFRPIALRKGFVATDDWGNPIVCYPRLTFSRVSLRDESVYDILFSLYQKGSLPVSIIYDILNLDPDDVKRGIKDDLFSVADPNFNEAIRGLITANLEDLYQQTNLASILIEEMGLKRIVPNAADPNLNQWQSPSDEDADGDADKSISPGADPSQAPPGGSKDPSTVGPSDVTTWPGLPKRPAPPAPLTPGGKVQFNRDKEVPKQHLHSLEPSAVGMKNWRPKG